MKKEGWIERFIRKRNEKKIAKLRMQFDFLIKEYNDSVKGISNMLETRFNALESGLDANKSSVEELLIEISRQIDEINAENVKTYENMKDTFSERFSQSQTKTESEHQDIIKVLQNIGVQLDLIQRNVNGVPDTTRTIVDEKNAAIVLGIDEVKTLMKVVAVNNLLEEIED